MALHSYRAGISVYRQAMRADLLRLSAPLAQSNGIAFRDADFDTSIPSINCARPCRLCKLAALLAGPAQRHCDHRSGMLQLSQACNKEMAHIACARTHTYKKTQQLSAGPAQKPRDERSDMLIFQELATKRGQSSQHLHTSAHTNTH